LQKSFANHWVMIIERQGSLTVLPAWDEKKVRRTRHFCGRAHASRYVERWIANPGMALVLDVALEAESNHAARVAQPEPASVEAARAEQMLIEDEFGEEMSSARLVPTPTPPAASVPTAPAPVQVLPNPRACILPPSLTQVAAPDYGRAMRVMS
jgi:hypothetical protein